MKKIYFLFIGIVLLISISTSEISAIDISNEILPQTSQLNQKLSSSKDIPVLNIGDSWTYRFHYRERIDNTILINFIIDDLYLRITEDRKDDYYGILSGNLSGEMDSLSFPLFFHDASFTGEFLIEKSTLGIKEWDMSIKTNKKIGPITIPLDVKITISANPSLQYFQFPLSVGNDWIIPSSTIDITVISILNSHTEYMIFSQSFENDNIQLTCISEEEIQVEAGSYMSFNITDAFDFHHCYYSLEVNNIVKLEVNNPLKDKIISMELLASSTQQYIGPNKPDKPIGPIDGQPGETYTYYVHHSDLDYESLYYLFDWDDGTDSGWLGPYTIDDEIFSTHEWEENGTYDIRVKTKNDFDQESPWSEALTIQIGEIGDITPPQVTIVKPSKSIVYLNDAKIGSFPFIIIIGFITVEVEAVDGESGINRVEFFVNDIKKGMDDTKPYTYYFNEPPGMYIIMVRAYDNAGNMNSDSVTVVNLF